METMLAIIYGLGVLTVIFLMTRGETILWTWYEVTLVAVAAIFWPIWIGIALVVGAFLFISFKAQEYVERKEANGDVNSE